MHNINCQVPGGNIEFSFNKLNADCTVYSFISFNYIVLQYVKKYTLFKNSIACHEITCNCFFSLLFCVTNEGRTSIEHNVYYFIYLYNIARVLYF